MTKPILITVVYVAMLTFDFSIFAGCGYLVAERGWSGWWFALAFLLACGSYPRSVFRAINGESVADPIAERCRRTPAPTLTPREGA